MTIGVIHELDDCRVCEGRGGDCDHCGGSGGGMRTFEVCSHCDSEIEFCPICGATECRCGGCACDREDQ